MLIVDDDVPVREPIARFFRSRGFLVEEAGTVAGTLEAIPLFHPEVAVLDYRLPDGDGLACMEALRRNHVSIPVILITGHGNVDLAVRAVKSGAEQFFERPVQLSALLSAVEACLGPVRKNVRSSARMRAARPIAQPFFGVSPAIRELETLARRVAASSAPVLVLGETGSGKSVLARWIHDAGPRSAQPWVDLNCAGLSRELVENELFGHERGAYTGAHSAKLGLFEAADQGTLFLDEIGDIDISVQPKLLKVIEEQTFRRVGEVRDRHVDVRLIAATRHDLAGLVQDRLFRDDLYFRINTLQLAMPALRDRREDIPMLARLHLDELTGQLGRGRVAITPQAERVLVDHAWPGNLRQLRNVLERALLLCDGEVLRGTDLHFDTADTPPASTARRTKLTLDELEREHILAVLREEGGHVESAARRLGVPRSSLYQKLKRFRVGPSKV